MTRPKINVEVCQTPNGMWMVRVQEWRGEELHDSNVCELGFEEATEIGRIALTLFHKRQIEPRTTITQDDQRAVRALCETVRGDMGACPHCGSDILGDGVTVALHCEFADESQLFECAPDEGPVFCTPESIGWE